MQSVKRLSSFPSASYNHSTGVFRCQVAMPHDQEKDFSQRHTLGRQPNLANMTNAAGSVVEECQSCRSLTDRRPPSPLSQSAAAASVRCQKWRRNTPVFRRGTHHVTLILTPTAQNASRSIALCQVSHLTMPLRLHSEWSGLGGVRANARGELKAAAASEEEQHRSLSSVLLLLQHQYSAAQVVLLLLLLIQQH